MSRDVVVDGTNVIMYAGEPKLENLNFILEELLRADLDPIVYFDASTRYKFSEIGELDPELRHQLTALSKKWQELDREAGEKARRIGDIAYKTCRVNTDVELLTNNDAVMWVKKSDVSPAIGKSGKNVRKVVEETGISITVKDEKDRPKGGFGPDTELFKTISKRIEKKTGCKLRSDAELYRLGNWLNGGRKWRLIDGRRLFEIRYWEEDEQGHLAIHDLRNPDLNKYEKLIKSFDKFVEVMAGIDADRRILDRAERRDSLVLSNDTFEEYRDEYPFVRDSNRLMSFSIKGDEVTIHNLPSMKDVRGLPDYLKEIEEKVRGKIKNFELTENAGEKILPLINRAEKKLTIYSPYISPRYAKMLVEKVKGGVDVKIHTSHDKAPYHQRSLQMFQGLQPTGDRITRKGIGVASLSVGTLLAIIAYAVYAPVAFFSALAFGIAILLMWSEGGSKTPGGLTLNILDNLHAKIYSRDDNKEVIFGSANLTESGMKHNLEVIGGISESGVEEERPKMKNSSANIVKKMRTST